MKDVLDFSQRPPAPKRPVVCMDETFKQLIGETREPLPPAPGRVERFDHVYVRNGVASLLLAFEAINAWRDVVVTDHRRRLECLFVSQSACAPQVVWQTKALP